MRSNALFRFCIVLFVSLFAITSCQQQPPPIRPPAALLEAPTTPPNLLRIASRSGAISDGLTIAAEQWTQLTGIQVIIEPLSYNYLQEQIFLDVQSDNSHYDVILIDDPWFPSLAGNGLLVPLAAFDYQPDDDFVSRSLEVAMWPPPSGPRHPFLAKQNVSQLYALPLVGNAQMFWYQTDSTAGFSSISDMITQLETVTSTSLQYGYAFAGQAGNPIVTEFNAWNWSYGGDIFDEDWNVVIDQEPSVQALTDFVRLSQSAHPDSITNGSSTSASRTVYEGDTVASLIWPTQIFDITNAQIPTNLSIGSFPKESQQATQLGHWLLAIPTTSSHKQEAYNFVLWATSQEMMKRSVHVGVPPTRTSVFQDPELTTQYPWLPNVESAVSNANWRPRTPEWPNIEHILGNYLASAIQGELEPQEALTQARTEIYALMLNAGYYD